MKSIYEFNRQLKELYNDAAIFRPISDQRTGELYRYDAILKPDNLKAFMITVPEFYEFPFIGRGFQFHN